jgi:hypothetical protein
MAYGFVRVTPRRQFVAFFASVVLVVGVSLALARRQRDQSRKDLVLSALPDDAWLVVSIDVDALRGSAFAKWLSGPASSPIAGVGSLTEPCGFDLLDRVRNVLVVSPEDGQRGDFGVAIAGTFARDELAACAEKVIRERGGRPMATTRGTFTLVSDTSSTGGARVAFRDGGLSLVGQGSWLDAMIDAADGRAARRGREHEGLRAALAESAAKATRRGPSQAIVLTALLPRAMRERIKSEAGERSQGSQGTVSGAAPPFEAMLSVDEAGIALTTGPSGSVSEIVAQLRCESPAACVDVEQFINRKRFEFSSDLRLRLVGLGPLIDTMAVERRDAAVSLRAQAPTDDLVRVLGSFKLSGGLPGSSSARPGQGQGEGSAESRAMAADGGPPSSVPDGGGT